MMLVINIPKEVYADIMIHNREIMHRESGKSAYYFEGLVQQGIPIPDDATNGDVIKTMFPNVNVYEHNGGATYSVNNEYNFNTTWWNSPYQKGGKE
jgi:hypothetical protein